MRRSPVRQSFLKDRPHLAVAVAEHVEGERHAEVVRVRLLR
jgi:hypothetical protein